MRILFIFVIALFSISAWAAPSIIPKPPSIAASSYILIDANSGEVIVEHEADTPLPPASLTKLMTSYIVNQELTFGNIQADETARVSTKAWKTPGSRMFIDVNSNVPIMDLLKGLIIQSGNDASVALAEHISGTEEAFADVMNQYAAELGMNKSHFVNSTGLPAAGHETTARDLSILARRLIFDHPENYGLYKEKKFKYNGIEQPNRNKLLFWDPKVDGLKTGHTEEAGYCLVASSKQGDMRLISVVMGAKSERARARESQKLLTYGFRYFETHKLFEDEQTLQTAPLWLGEKNELNLGVRDGVYITIPRGQQGNLDIEYSVDEVIKAPISEGTEYGQLTVSLEGDLLLEKPLIAMEDIEEAGFFARIWDYIKLFFSSLFG